MILYRTIQTASLTTPSPKSIANNFGSVSSLTNVSAATVSVALITEANNNTSFTERLIVFPSSKVKVNSSKLLAIYVKGATTKKAMMVPSTPKART